MIASPVAAKRVACIDIKKVSGSPVEDVFPAAKEGWKRQRAQADTVVVRGGSLTTCTASVESGDMLVIITHGPSCAVGGLEGQGFTWDGTEYTGFGSSCRAR